MTTRPNRVTGPPEPTVPGQRPTAPPQAPADPGRPGIVLGLMSACVVLVVGMVAAINLAVPDLAASRLHPSSGALLWIVDAYVIVFACLLIPAGAVGDRFGRKATLLAGLAVFAGGAALSAAAGSVPVMLTGRAVTGFGAAAVLPNTLALVINVFPPPRRPAAVATWASMTGVGGIVGNVGGGLALELGSWRTLFVAVVPFALGLAALVAHFVPRTPTHRVRLDVPGALGLTASFVALLYGIIEGPELGWGAPRVLGAFGVALAVFGIWMAYELRIDDPLLDPRVFRIPLLRAASLGMTIAFFGLFALFYVNAQYLQYGKGYSVLVTGLAIAPMAAMMVVVSRRGTGLVARFGQRTVVATALGLITAGLALLSTAGPGTPYVLYLVFLLVLAGGCGLALPALSNGIVHALPPARAGVASGINSTTRELGSALGVAVVGTVLSTRFAARTPTAARSGSAGGTRTVAAALARVPTSDAATRAAVIRAFTSALDLGLRVITVVVAVAAVLVIVWHPAPAAGSDPSNG